MYYFFLIIFFTAPHKYLRNKETHASESSAINWYDKSNFHQPTSKTNKEKKKLLNSDTC